MASKLLGLKGIKKPLTRLDDRSSAKALSTLLQQVRSGANLAVVSDAGTPVVSDPGAALVDLAYSEGIEVDSVPGPSAVANALALSGFFAQRYVFLGFLPRKLGGIRAELEPYVESTLTIVLFESPFRVTKTLEAVLQILGDRRACACREMTKLHQQVERGRLSELVQRNLSTKGEYTVVIEGLRRQIAEYE